MSRPDGPVKVLMTPDAMEAMVVRDHLGRSLTWAWGEPDEEGCYTPTISVALDDPAAQDMADGRALRLLEKALPTGTYFELSSGHSFGWLVDVRDVHMGDLVVTNSGPTIAAAADACRDAIEATR